MFLVQSQIINELAENGPGVFVGRCADYILKNRKRCLRVWIGADESSRTRRLYDEYWIRTGSLTQKLRIVDEGRAAYYKRCTGQIWGEHYNYHMHLDSGAIGIEACSKVICSAAKKLLKNRYIRRLNLLLEISHGTVSFGAETILSNIHFIIKNAEKIAIVGRNGCGKTTLLNLISGKIDLDKRDSDQDVFIVRRGGLTIGYLQQNAFEDDSITLEDEVKKAFQKILDMKARLDQLLELMENDATENIVQEYVDLLDHFQNMGGYEYEKECELLIG